MQCPAGGHSYIGRVDSLGRLRADPTPLFSVATLPSRAHSVPRLPRDFYFQFSKNHAGIAVRPAGLTLLSRSFP